MSTRQGLSSSVYKSELRKAIRFMRAAVTSVVHINEPAIGAEAHLTFSGPKPSEVGPKELNADVDFLARTRAVRFDLFIGGAHGSRA